MRVGAHAPTARRRQGPELGHEPAAWIEQLLGPVAAHPVLEELQVRRIVAHVGEGHLVRAPGRFHFVTLDFLRPGPPLGRAQHDHGPAGTERIVRVARVLLIGADFAERLFQRGGHRLVHHRRVAAFYEIRLVSVADKQRFQLLVADSRQDGWIRDLVAVEVQNRQHGAITHGVDELVGMPRRRERPCFGLAVTHHAGDDEIGVVKRHAVRVGEAVTEFAALVNRTRRFRRDVAPDMARKGELLEELLQPFGILALVRIDLRVGPFEINGTQHARCAVAGPGHEDQVEVVLDDHPVQMHPDEGQRRARAPVTEQAVLHMIRFEGLLEQRVVLQVDHSHREVVARPPIGVRQLQVFVRCHLFHGRSPITDRFRIVIGRRGATWRRKHSRAAASERPPAGQASRRASRFAPGSGTD